jgi:CDP-diacylglycerol--glycerol-3-phosphate 3-phosphatidyltransferase
VSVEQGGSRDGVAARPRLTTPANLLGIARILLTPVVIGLLLLPFPGAGLLAAALFALAAATDFIDGWVARARGEVSPLGVFMDLTADKVLVAGVMVAMVQVALLPTWIAATILIREFVVQGVRQLAASVDVVIASRALGKAKTVATLVGMVILILSFDARTGDLLVSADAGAVLATIGLWVMVAATALTVVSGADYLRVALPILTGERPDRPPT